MSCTLTDRCAGLRVGRRGVERVKFGIGDRVKCPQVTDVLALRGEWGSAAARCGA